MAVLPRLPHAGPCQLPEALLPTAFLLAALRTQLPAEQEHPKVDRAIAGARPWRRAMDSDEWRKKREQLIGQLRDLEAGRISQWDEGGRGELNRYTTEESIERVKQRLANLDAKFQQESGG
jgi:hypothetical protein